MLAVVQRVSRAKVSVAGEVVGEIGRGFLLLVCALQGDTRQEADKLLSKLLKLRVFNDAQGKMNRSLQNLDGQGTQGGLLIVSQFTLAADLRGGNRPSFTHAAGPALGRELYDYLIEQARKAHPIVQTGRFGTEMAVELVNDGPVTIPMHIEPVPSEPH
ncbi:MAG: D-aminoacyl-tRNA deacylase [Rhodoferax sp.]|nr:D-aminoacyl-tRNA deacylase [Rhodoferax sp.]